MIKPYLIKYFLDYSQTEAGEDEGPSVSVKEKEEETENETESLRSITDQVGC